MWGGMHAFEISHKLLERMNYVGTWDVFFFSPALQLLTATERMLQEDGTGKESGKDEI